MVAKTLCEAQANAPRYGKREVERLPIGPTAEKAAHALEIAIKARGDEAKDLLYRRKMLLAAFASAPPELRIWFLRDCPGPRRNGVDWANEQLRDSAIGTFLKQCGF